MHEDGIPLTVAAVNQLFYGQTQKKDIFEYGFDDN